MPPVCNAASAISGLPTTMVATRSGSFTSRASSSMTLTSAPAAAPGTAPAITPIRSARARRDPRLADPSRGPQGRNEHAIAHSRALRVDQPDNTAATGQVSARLDAKMVNEPQMPPGLAALVPERIEHLLAEARWNLVGHPVGVRTGIVGHAEGPEENIENRKRRGKILVASPV